MTNQRKMRFSQCDADMFQLMAGLCRPQNVASPEITFAVIVVRFDQYFKVNVSERQATQAFHRRKQGPVEKAQEYLAALRQLAGPCNFTDFDRSSGPVNVRALR